MYLLFLTCTFDNKTESDLTSRGGCTGPQNCRGGACTLATTGPQKTRGRPRTGRARKVREIERVAMIPTATSACNQCCRLRECLLMSASVRVVPRHDVIVCMHIYVMCPHMYACIFMSSCPRLEHEQLEAEYERQSALEDENRYVASR